MFSTKCLASRFLFTLSLSVLSSSLLAQPSATYTVSGTPGHYTLDFTLNNTTPQSPPFDLYSINIQVNGAITGTPSGYYGSTFASPHYISLQNNQGGTTSYGPFNVQWIDATYTRLPPGNSLTGFEVSDSDLTAPTSVPFYFFATDGGGLAAYTGPGNLNLNSYNPFFAGNAIEVVPEPTALSIVALSGLILLLYKGQNRHDERRVEHSQTVA